MKNLSNSNIFSREEQDIAKDLLNSINLNSNKNEVSPFLTSLEQKILDKVVKYSAPDVQLDFFGGIEDSERKRAKIIVNEYYDIDYDIVCLHASFNSKFNIIKHRDVMGAVHNLGINFNRVGDIIVKDEDIYIFADKTIADYILMNFSQIGRAVLNFEIIENLESLSLEKDYEQINIVASSHRIDSIVSKITNKSRSKVKEMLEKDFIKLNHSVINSGEKNCSVGDMISIRKYGRYTIKESNQNSKSLKYRISLDKFV
ncbi:MAG: YlmH/Sll1252 family protein [Gemella sp.]|nr:YlmH/Sll1252 family protein [Gemella sp.]